MQTVENNTPRNMMFQMMTHCATNMRWMPLLPITVGTALLLLGYFMEAESVRIVFLTLAALPVIMGVFGFIMMNIMRK